MESSMSMITRLMYLLLLLFGLALAGCATGILVLWRILYAPFGYALRAGLSTRVRGASRGGASHIIRTGGTRDLGRAGNPSVERSAATPPRRKVSARRFANRVPPEFRIGVGR